MARTRQAILDAAVALLRRDPTASTGAVADAAGTARSTLHRHFPDRARLIAALRDHADQQVADATERARPHEGSGAEALRRVCQEYFELGDLISVAYADFTQADDPEGHGGIDTLLIPVIERGHADGTIDAAMPATWVHHLLWHALDAAWTTVGATTATKHQALTLCLHTLDKLVEPPTSGSGEPVTPRDG